MSSPAAAATPPEAVPRGAASQIELTGIERTFQLQGITVEERALVPHELGALVLEWSAPEPVLMR